MDRRVAVIGVLVALLQSLLLAPIGLILRHVFEEALPARDEAAVVIDVGASLTLSVLSALLTVVSRRVLIGQARLTVARFREELLAHVLWLPRDWHDKQDAGKLQALLVADSHQVDQMLSSLFNVLLPALASSVTLGVVACVLAPLPFLGLMAIVPLALLTGRFLGRRIRHWSAQWLAAYAQFSSGVASTLRGITLTKAEATEPGELARRKGEIQVLAGVAGEFVSAQSMHSAAQQMVQAVAGAIVLLVGALSVISGDLRLGELIAFYAVTALILRQFAMAVPALDTVIAGGAALSRLEALRDDRPAQPYRGDAPVAFTGRLGLERVGFAYDGGPLVLDDLTLEVAAGDRVAIVGPSGAGKTTLLELLLGIRAPVRGRILADGVPYDVADLERLRASFGVVLQDPVLMADTIRANIVYGAPAATEADVREAAIAAGVSDFAGDLEHGLESPIGEAGARLSAGQRQRVAIARALARRPALLLMDEPTSFLDTLTVRRLIGGLDLLIPRPTVVVMTHDAELAAAMDRTYRLEAGRLRPQDERLA
jgi:ABC-type multidrug transport system fused ATPase/permease subunit